MKRRGLSLIEVLLAIAIFAIAIGAVSRAFSTGILFEQKAEASRGSLNERVRFEDKMSRLIGGATLHGAGTFMVSPIPVSAAGLQQYPTNSDLGPGSASLVFSSTGEGLPEQFRSTGHEDFEALNSRFGPLAGAAEVAFSTIPVGDAGLKTGLFLREQRPPDGDLTQGGVESLLNDKLADIRFEFYDGSTWQTTWDTRNGQKSQLPTAIRVTYLLAGEQLSRSFLVRLPLVASSAGTPAPIPSSSSTTTTNSTPTAPGGHA